MDFDNDMNHFIDLYQSYIFSCHVYPKNTLFFLTVIQEVTTQTHIKGVSFS